jgi:hypothetical protein
MTDASRVSVAAILTQPDDGGHQHPVAFESCKLTAVEQNYPADVLELMAVPVVNTLQVFKHCLLGRGALLPTDSDCGEDFDLLTDNQALTCQWLKTNRSLIKMYVSWLDKIEDFRFQVRRHTPAGYTSKEPCRYTFPAELQGRKRAGCSNLRHGP